MSTIFSKIIRGEVPSRMIWDDEHCAAFLDVNPTTIGHTLVVPKEEIDRWTDLDPALAAHLFTVAQRIGKVQCESFPCERAGLMICGYEIPHTHVHIWPSNSINDFDLNHVVAKNDQIQDEAAAKLRQGLIDAGFGEYVPN